jgi:ubiquinone/menaquinone biosynthesis C-methylase UbiE
LEVKVVALARFITKRMPEAIPPPGAIFYNAIPAKLLWKVERKIANDIVDRVTTGTVIDLGSGPGYLSIEIAKMAPEIKVYGLDLSREMVRIARRHAKDIKNVQFEVGDAAELSFENESVDFIVSTGSLHHWKRPTRVFNECHRVLKSGSEAWIYDGCSDIPKEEANKRVREHGLVRYHLLNQVQKLHGFTWAEYRGRIKGVLDQSAFQDSYQMELTDFWMKITLRKSIG